MISIQHKPIRLTVLMLFVTLFSSTLTFAQKTKPFMGKLTYKITPRDPEMKNIVPENKMFLFTNDTITRMENFTGQLGQQVTIRHIEKNKSYLLLATPIGNFAIKADLNLADSVKKESKYSFKKKWFKKKVCGMRANRMMVTHPDFEEPIEFLYLKKYSNEYLNNLDGIPGLPVRYSVVTPDAILDYELVKWEEYVPDRDLFGIPADYERVTFDEFMDKMFPPEEQQQGEN